MYNRINTRVMLAGLALAALAGCSQQYDDRNNDVERRSEVIGVTNSTFNTIQRFYDNEQGNVCYVLGDYRAISCLPKKENK